MIDAKRPYWVGWGCVWAVYFACLDLGVPFSIEGCTRMPNDVYSVASLVAGMLVFASMAVLGVVRGSGFCRNRRLAVGAVLAWLASLVAVFFFPDLLRLDAAEMDVLFAAAGAVSTLAWAYCLLYYQALLLDGPVCIPRGNAVALSLAVGAVLYAAIAFVSALVAFFIMFGALVVAAVLGASPVEASSADDQGLKKARRELVALWPLLVGVCVAGLLFSVVRQVAYTVPVSYDMLNAAASLAGAFAVGAYIAAWRLMRRFNPSIMLGALFLAAGLMLTLLPKTDGIAVVGCLLCFRFVMGFGEVALLVALLEVQKRGCNMAFSTALAHAAITISFAVGIVPFSLSQPGSLSAMQVVTISVDALYGVALVAVVLLRASRGQVVESGEGSATDGGDDTAHEADLFAALARVYALSPREVDVLKLLAQGRSGPYIAEKLYISVSTVKSHTAHVYKKLGVGSRQELLDVIQARRQP